MILLEDHLNVIIGHFLDCLIFIGLFGKFQVFL